jgi:hypothetical protein
MVSPSQVEIQACHVQLEELDRIVKAPSIRRGVFTAIVDEQLRVGAARDTVTFSILSRQAWKAFSLETANQVPDVGVGPPDGGSD